MPRIELPPVDTARPDAFMLPPGYALSTGKLRSGLAPGRPFYWRLTQRLLPVPGWEHMPESKQPNHVAIVREGQEPTEAERERAMAAAATDIRRQEST